MASDFLEKTLEDIIYENRKIIHLRGLPTLRPNAYRQFILPSGKKVDILAFEIQNGCLMCDIYELKKDIINSDAVCQAFGYYQEIKCLTKPFFRRIEGRIIMIGRKYEPVSILDSLSIPIDVYTYEYLMDGIRFIKNINPYVSHSPHKSFSFGMWAFGYDGLVFTNDQTSVSLHSTFEKYALSNSGYENEIKSTIESWLKEVSLPETVEEEKEKYPLPEIRKSITTVIFPEQPGWSPEFASQIPHNDIFEDNYLDYADDEIEEDNDTSDFELGGDDEEDSPHEAWFVTEWDYEQVGIADSIQRIFGVNKDLVTVLRN